MHRPSPRLVQAHNLRNPQQVPPLFFTEDDRTKERALYPGSPRRGPRGDEGYQPSFSEEAVRRGYSLTEHERTKGFPDGRPPLYSHEDLTFGHHPYGRYSQRFVEQRQVDTERNSPIHASSRKIPPWERDMEYEAFQREKLKKQQQLEQLEKDRQNLERELQEMARQRDTGRDEMERKMEKDRQEKDRQEKERQERERQERERQWRVQMDNKRQAQYPNDPDHGRRQGYGYGQMEEAWSKRVAKLSSNNGGAFLFVFFPRGSKGENVHVVAKACVRAKTSDLGGRFAGIADKVISYKDAGNAEGKYHDCCLVFRFTKMENAKLFYDYDHFIRKQVIEPASGRSEVFALGLRFNPEITREYDTFLMCQLVLTNATLDEYEEYFVQPMTDLLNSLGALPFVAYSKTPHDRESVYSTSFGSRAMLTLHMFKIREHLEVVRQNDEYRRLTEMLYDMADVKAFYFFTIDRDACP